MPVTFGFMAYVSWRWNLLPHDATANGMSGTTSITSLGIYSPRQSNRRPNILAFHRKGVYYCKGASADADTHILRMVIRMAITKKIVKPTLLSHSGSTRPPLTFADAYRKAQMPPKQSYFTTGNSTEFIMQASIARRGQHIGQKVIRFKSQKDSKWVQRACAYDCCWNHITNCDRQHIDCYTEAIY